MAAGGRTGAVVVVVEAGGPVVVVVEAGGLVVVVVVDDVDEVVAGGVVVVVEAGGPVVVVVVVVDDVDEVVAGGVVVDEVGLIALAEEGAVAASACALWAASVPVTTTPPDATTSTAFTMSRTLGVIRS